MSQSAPINHNDASCIACGYDLRNNPNGVCPECGLGLDDRTTLRQQRTMEVSSWHVGIIIAGWLIMLPVIFATVLLFAYALAAALK